MAKRTTVKRHAETGALLFACVTHGRECRPLGRGRGDFTV